MEEQSSFGFNLKDRKTIVAVVGLLVLLISIPLAVYLIQQKQIFKPRAFEPKGGQLAPLSGPETSFTLATSLDGGPNFVPLGQKVRVSVFARSDVDAANLFAAKLKFPANILEVEEIITQESSNVIKNWVEKISDNKAGTISLVGGVPAPGYKTTVGQPTGKVAEIVFGTKAVGDAYVDFDEGTAIYRNSDNSNILSIKREVDFRVLASSAPSLQVNFVNSTGSPVSSESCTVYWDCNGGGGWTTSSCQTSSNRTINLASSHPAGWCKGVAVSSSNLAGVTPVPVDGLKTTTKDRNLYGWENSWSSGSKSLTFIVNSAATPTPTLASNIGMTISVESVKVKIPAGSSFEVLNLTSTGADGFTMYGYPTTYGPGINWIPSSGGMVVGRGVPISIQVNQNVKSGIYTGTAVIKGLSGSAQVTLPVEVTVEESGDVNSDGKITLVDMSALLSKWGKTKAEAGRADINGDGVVNTIDYSMMVKILIEKRVIKSAEEAPPAP